MRLQSIALALVCTGLTAAPLTLAAQDPAKKPGPAEKKPAPPAMDEKAMMEKWKEIATPGTPHKSLAALEGTWNTKVKSWMAPAAPPNESEGLSENKMVLDGRFLEQHFTGNYMGQPFHGLGHTGYDNYKKRYVATWMDTMGTMVMVMEGSGDPSGKVITSTGTVDDFMTGKPAKIKSVTTIIDPDHHTYEMWAPGPDGKVYKNMEIHYYRKK